MNPSPAPLAQRLARRLLPQRRRAKTQLPAFSVPAAAIHTLQGPDDFRQTLLQLIGSAQRRIVLVALYLQDDEGGRQVLAALYEAKRARPQLEIEVYVDWHRARRGLIGQQASAGNAALYRSWAEREGAGVAVYGVPVQNRELFGVLHLKGFIVDDTVLYSGASLNDVYLGVGGRYRLDRYHVIAHAPLAESMAALVRSTLQASEAVQRLDRTPLPSTRELQAPIRSFRRDLQQAQYEVPMADGHDGVAVTPLLGFGRSDNRLNEVLLELLHGARQRVVLFTPYFNLPRAVRSTLNGLLRRGVQVDIMVGDKTANDFYIPPSQPFRRIGLLPYLYESNLRRFARSHQGAISRGQLNLWLWRDGDNSYHLKGLLIDRDCAVITGNNLNPRAWALDLENGLLLRDPHEQLLLQHEAEWAQLRSHATRVASYTDLQSARHYPAEVRRLLRRLSRVRLDRLINRLL